MCGIAGFLDFKGSDQATLSAVVGKMADQLEHRGPDDRGVWCDEQNGVALGHRRLAIIDCSQHGHQPMSSECSRYVCAYNGEIYNFRQLADELRTLGHHFHGHSDTEVLLAAIEEWGLEAALKRFNGMFAIALWDKQSRTLSLARDRLGEKPLYYGWSGQALLFGSELKALKVHPAFAADINRDALALYLRHCYIPQPYSIYQGIAKLPPGSYITLSARSGAQPLSPGTLPEPTTYWSARSAAEAGLANPLPNDPAAVLAELDQQLRRSVAMRMVADVPLGAFLSGGIDSSLIVALMQAQSSTPVKSFSIGFHEQEYNEAQYAAAVAKHLGTDHTELYVTSEQAMDVIPQLPTLYDEPFSDASQIPTYLVSKIAREHVTVALSGDGGDELFCGYERYFFGGGIWRRVRWLPSVAKRSTAWGLNRLTVDQWNQLFGRFGGLLPSRLQVKNPGSKLHKLADVFRLEQPEALYLSLLSHWEPPTQVVLGATEPPTSMTNPAQWAELDDFLQRMMFWDLTAYLPDDILVKVDRAAMGVSLETRVPMLDHHLVEFAQRIPQSMKVRGGQGKMILRQLLANYVPNELFDRPKMGFGVPIDGWLRGPLRDWAESLLDRQRLEHEGFFNPQPIREKWQQHLSGQFDWQYHLWDVLMFQAWLEAQSS